jgi:hypothetical protein
MVSQVNQMLYRNRDILSAIVSMLLVANGAFSQQAGGAAPTAVHLQVEAGIPLRVYITRRVPYRVGEKVNAKLIEPVWAFDRIVIPAGTAVQGEVVKLDPISKIARAHAILGGDLTPLKRAQVSFRSLTLPDGRTIPIQTEQSLGLRTIFVEPRPPKKTNKAQKQNNNPAKPSPLRQFLQQQLQTQVQTQASARTGGIYDLVRGPNKREWIENYILSKVPYHPQWYRTRTRFDTVLSQPLDFGAVEIPSTELAKEGTPAPSEAIAQMRLLTTVSSADAHIGDPMQGVLSQPLFTPQHELVFPEGTRFAGKITLTQRARLFHRGGKLRFVIENVNLPEIEAASDSRPAMKQVSRPLQGQLRAVEGDPNAIKVDAEGTATATESKTRLLRPAIAALIAAKSLDNDSGKQTASGGSSTDANYSGRSLGGFSGFGVLGTLAARGPRPIGAALGFYGLAWSVYSNVVARGSDVTFEKNTAIAIQFGSPRNK